MDTLACNYDSDANAGNGCLYPTTYYDCDNNCLNDSDGDGVCDELEVLGCADETAVNFNSDATEDDGTCSYVVLGCTDEAYLEYNINATEDDGSCATFIGCADEGFYEYNVGLTCESKRGDSNSDNIIDLDDLFAVLGAWLVSGPDLAGDVNNDEIVDLQDLFDVLGNWLN